MSNFQFIILFISILLATSTIFISNTAYAYSSNVTDQQALLSVRDSISLDPLGVLNRWNHSIHFCQWKGVTCSRRRQRVTMLNLSSYQLDGTLSPHIGNLSFLRAIYLDRNNFRGSIPREIGHLFRLRYLHLGSNLFEGRFPVNLSHCLDIRNISIQENKLQGRLPTEFTSWSKLTTFNAQKNHFIGSIPPSVGNISFLRFLDIGSNNLTGSIPSEVAQLSKLELLQLSGNNLVSMVPLTLYNISTLYYISLTQNNLEGRLPGDLGVTIPKLQIFLVGGNKFSGPFPLSITNASKLVEFELALNYNISGPLPMNLGSLSSLQWLNLGYNQLGHNQPDSLSFLSSLVNCTSLDYLGIHENGFRGELPSSIVNFSTTLGTLDFSGNYIYGSIPQEIGKLWNMTTLSLGENMLTGSIPESVCKLSKLEGLFLYDNNISGVIPACINNISGLYIFSSGSNMLHGSIPTALFNISSLQELYLFNNHLSGMIPESSMSLLTQCRSLYLDRNLLTGPLASSIGSLKHLVWLSLYKNKLTGEIPSSLGDCVMLEELYMEGNLFEGRIPSSFKDLKNLAFLDLSNNNMSGNIPHFLEEFQHIQFLNLSHNKFGGEVPKRGVFSNVSAFSVIGNSQLCGGIQPLQLQACPTIISKTTRKQFPLKIILLVVLLPLAILFSCVALIFYRHRKSLQMNVPVLQDDQYPRLSYQDLVLATDEFSLNNLLGEGRYGSVYKGNLESLKIFAVKVLNVEVHGAYKSFLAECEALKNIRHRNLIKIITTCSSTDFKGKDFKAIVFDYMINGSLDKWLYPIPSHQMNRRSLTLLQRLNIAIDVALAVDYLHYRCPTRIIHCDIKPSNILLDEEFVARVGDFGLARFFLSDTGDINHAQTSSTSVRGTVGYVPPEYGMGAEVSTEGDVYSYGILLLEMFSGNRPTSSSILVENAYSLHDYIRKALPHRVMEIADPNIMLEQENHDLITNKSVGSCKSSTRIIDCLDLIFEVGVQCSVEMPRERIDINVALKKLHVAREKLLLGSDLRRQPDSHACDNYKGPKKE